MNCPECDTWLSANKTSCRCGWEAAPKGKSHPLGYPQCSWESDGMRCRYPGSMTSSTQSDSDTKWFCSSHFGCIDPRGGASIVEASRDYKRLAYDIRPLNQEAHRYCRQNALDTVDQMRAFINDRMRRIGRKKAA
jgi:hypothetical protein